MKNEPRKNPILLPAIFLAVFLVSALVSTLLSARNTTASASPENQHTLHIDLYDETVSPDTITVKVGQSVMVNNKSSKPRELSLGAGDASSGTHDEQVDHHGSSEHSEHDHTEGYSSGMFDTDEAWKVTFNEPGTYFLHDHSNPKVNILVVAYE